MLILNNSPSPELYKIGVLSFSAGRLGGGIGHTKFPVEVRSPQELRGGGGVDTLPIPLVCLLAEFLGIGKVAGGIHFNLANSKKFAIIRRFWNRQI